MMVLKSKTAQLGSEKQNAPLARRANSEWEFHIFCIYVPQYTQIEHNVKLGTPLPTLLEVG